VIKIPVVQVEYSETVRREFLVEKLQKKKLKMSEIALLNRMIDDIFKKYDIDDSETLDKNELWLFVKDLIGK
jgi:hypothetical protein